MKIVVIGGSGLIGTKVVKKLTEQGHEALAASPNTGVDATTGQGLAEALAGAEVVVDVSNSPSFEDAAVLAFFESSGRNLARAEQEAGVRHHVALSVVGTDRLQDSGYFRAKLAQERLIKNVGHPLHDRPGNAVLRISRRDRRCGRRRQPCSPVECQLPAHRCRRCRQGRGGRCGWRACQRHDRDRGSRAAADERDGRALPQGNQRPAGGRERSPGALFRRSPRRSLAGARRQCAPRDHPPRGVAPPAEDAIGPFARRRSGTRARPTDFHRHPERATMKKTTRFTASALPHDEHAT